MWSQYAAGVYAFTLGCLAFTIDAVRARPLRRFYLCGCVLFDVGCIFFILDAHAVGPPQSKT